MTLITRFSNAALGTLNNRLHVCDELRQNAAVTNQEPSACRSRTYAWLLIGHRSILPQLTVYIES